MRSERLAKRIGRTPTVWKLGWLCGYSLVFNKEANDGSGYANICPQRDSVVYGVLYALTEDELQKLDQYEGVPCHYRRIILRVETKEGPQHAECYVAVEDKVKEGLKPRKDYLQHLIQGAKEHNLPEEYILKLRNVETL
ncbi:MAG TPA: gamma-glutamylcyclotransferase [Candidatus Acetothermia bacterium]|nr:gamma-glutamylcyclotransferase [Candidatus Acetothermia bacterium]